MSGPGRYEVRLLASAERDLDRLHGPVFERVTRAALCLEVGPRPRGCTKLHGRDAYRIRVGDYRVLYTVDDRRRLVEIVAIGHRKDVYR